MVDLHKLLNPDDSEILEGSPAISWIPKDPREPLLPYMSDTKDTSEYKSVDYRREKAKEVISGYDKIIDKCKQMESMIEQRCKNVSVKLNRQQHLRVIEAIGRVFGIETDEITFEMYKQCILTLSSLANERIPKIGV